VGGREGEKERERERKRERRRCEKDRSGEANLFVCLFFAYAKVPLLH
jgi:hypothetical protein